LLKRFIEPLFVCQDGLVAGILYGLDLVLDLDAQLRAIGETPSEPIGETP
jgi:hypothetical protein